ncbi:MAG: hypothetical protein ABH886_01640 [Candidatus Desantisbacteria bacterium]
MPITIPNLKHLTDERRRPQEKEKKTKHMNQQMNKTIKLSKNIWIITAIFITALVVGVGVYWWQESKTARNQQVLEDFFKVYGSDKGANHEEINFYVAVPKNFPLLEKLKLLADRLSRFEFQYHPINVLGIKSYNNKKIAIIELNELNYPEAFTWRGGYFQGSTGGGFTTLTLTKTFLQEDYKGNWIDGVKFYYEGKPISSDWDHIALSGTIWRKTKR